MQELGTVGAGVRGEKAGHRAEMWRISKRSRRILVEEGLRLEGALDVSVSKLEIVASQVGRFGTIGLAVCTLFDVYN